MMKTLTRITPCALALTLLLAGCGSGGGGDSGSVTTPPPAPPPVAMLDAFYSAVLAIIATSPEDKEPVEIDSVAVTTPDNTDPVAN
ncbi:hypothetical protein [Pseudoduganella aquatica]|uniref:Uncharacterized protein n=1 Tax=Pseudoduganella aquatica TaxID=2660641 RepID=A0A7X4HA44_9BURK|nr:hypothetical protein [Pseudoduganella aquatica]MYN06542.1 hypothetical protein [Pseudoduganella aquatica]